MAVMYESMIKIGVDTSEIDSGMSKAEGAVSSFGETAKGVFAANLIYDGIKKIGSAMVDVAKSSIDAGMSFDKSMSQVAATMGYSVEDIQNNVNGAGDTFNQLRDYAQDMGATTAFSASQAADALNYMALAGYDAETSMDTLPTVLDLAAAGNMDLARASDMVTDASSALGLSLDETKQLVDQMAQASSKSNTSVEQLGDAILTVGGTAKNLAGGTTELSTALGIMADNGIKGAEAGTHMRNILLALNPTTDKAVAAFEELGVNAYDADGNLKPLNETFGELAAALDSYTEQGKTELISEMFNKTDLAAVEALLSATEYDLNALSDSLSNSGINWSNYSDAINDTNGGLGEVAELISDWIAQGTKQEHILVRLSDMYGLNATDAQKALEVVSAGIEEQGNRWSELTGYIDDASGAASEMAETQLDNLAGDVTMFQSALEGAQIAISDGLTPSLRFFVQAGTEALSQFKTGLEEGGIQGAIENLMPVFSSFATNVYNAIIEGWPVIIQAGTELLNNLASGIEQSLPELIPTALNTLMEFSGSLRENIGSLVDAGLHLIKTLAQALIDNLPEFIKTVPTIVTNIAGIINDNMPKILITGGEIILSLIKGIIQSVPTLIAEFPKIIQSIIAVWSAVNWLNVGKFVITKIKEGITFLIHELPNAIKGIGETALEWFKLIDWKTLGSDVIDLIGMGIENVVTSIPTAMSEIASSALEAFTSIDWIDVGVNIINGIVDGVTDMAGSLADAALSAVSDAWNAMTSWLDISSPSKKAEKVIGKNWVLGIGKGFENFMPVDDMVNAVSDAMDEMDDALPEEVPFDDISISTLDVGEGKQGRGGRVFAPVFNIYGGDGQDVNELADEIMDRLTFLYDREEAAYGTA